jgi:hypothetical protein
MKKIKDIMQFFECFLLNAMKKEENKGNNAIFLKCLLLNAMKNEENKGNNAICWMFLVECDEK